MSTPNKADQLRWIQSTIDFCNRRNKTKRLQTKEGKQYNLYTMKEVPPEEADFFFGQYTGAVTVDSYIVVISPRYSTSGWKQRLEHVDIVINDINKQN